MDRDNNKKSALSSVEGPALPQLPEGLESAFNRGHTFPMEGQQESKIWPAVARIDNAFGDRNLVCTCPSVEAVAVAA